MPSGLKARQSTQSVWPVSLAFGWPVAVSQSWTTPFIAGTGEQFAVRRRREGPGHATGGQRVQELAVGHVPKNDFLIGSRRGEHLAAPRQCKDRGLVSPEHVRRAIADPDAHHHVLRPVLDLAVLAGRGQDACLFVLGDGQAGTEATLGLATLGFAQASERARRFELSHPFRPLQRSLRSRLDQRRGTAVSPLVSQPDAQDLRPLAADDRRAGGASFRAAGAMASGRRQPSVPPRPSRPERGPPLARVAGRRTW